MRVPIWILNTLLAALLAVGGWYLNRLENIIVSLHETDSTIVVAQVRTEEDVKELKRLFSEQTESLRNWQFRIDREMSHRGWSPYRDLKK